MTRTELEGRSPRSLNLLASFVCRQPVRVHLTSRIEAACVLSAKSRTLFLDPARAGVRELLVGSVLLRETRRVREHELSPGVPEEIARGWLARAEAELFSWLPGARTLAPGGPTSIVWDQVSYRPLDARDLGPGRNGGDLIDLPGVTVDGAEEDFAAILRALSEGTYPLERDPRLPELPVATIRLKISAHEASPANWERLSRTLEEVEDTVRAIVKCQLSSWDGKPERELRAPRAYGSRLDPARLHDIIVASKEGRNAPAFRHPRDVPNLDFDPDRYLTVIGLDLNSFSGGSLGTFAMSRRLSLLFARVAERMSNDFAIVATADRIVELPDGQRVYLHLPLAIKGRDEPLDEAAWARLSHALELPAAGGGSPATFHPFLFDLAAREIDAAEEEKGYHAHLLEVCAARAFGDPALETDGFLSRVAATLDARLDELSETHASKTSVIAWIPAGIKDRGRPGGQVAQMHTL